MGRERSLAALAALLGAICGLRLLPPREVPAALGCARSQVGRVGELATCGGPEALTGGQRRVLGLPLDLNSATAEELDALPGIGAALAARIVEDRAAHGPFASLDDLRRVSGIGPGKLRSLAGQATAMPVRR